MKIIFRTWCIFVVSALITINAMAADVTEFASTESSRSDLKVEGSAGGVPDITFSSGDPFVSEYELISFNFQNTDIRTVLQAVTENSKLNIVISDTVIGDISLRLDGVSWAQALEIIMQSKELWANWDGYVLCIAPRGGSCQEQRERTEQQRETEDVIEPLRTQILQLNGISPFALLEMLSGTNVLSERGSVIVDIRTNKLIVTDITEGRDYFAALLAQLDVLPQQVMVEVRIVEAPYGWGRHVRARMMQPYWQNKAEDTNLQIITGAEAVVLDGSWAGGHIINLQNKEHMMAQFNLPHSFGAMNTDIYAYQFSSGFGELLQQELNELTESQFGRSIASPRLMTASGWKARVEQGIQIPDCEASCCGSAMNFNRREALVFETTPYITADQRIVLNVSIEGEYFNGTEMSDLVNQVMTYGVSIDNGGALIIGGLSRSRNVKAAVIPECLTDIPIIGRFIQPPPSSQEGMELILFITPRIVDEDFFNQHRRH